MAKKNTIRLTESDLKKIISESVKNVLKESIKAADTMNAVSPELAKECGFKLEYENVDGGFQLWGGPLPEDNQEKISLLRKLGIKKFTSENYMNHTCRITVDPSGKVANIGKKGGNPILMKLAELLKQNKISSDKAVQILVSKGIDENKARTWVAKNAPKNEEYGY